MRKVLYFGSFNPVHYGHVAIAVYVARMDDVDAVTIVPSPHNPFKSTATLADPQLRLEQVRKAFEGLSPKITVSDIEYHLPEPLYTINTLRAFQTLEPETELVLLVGADNIGSISRWYHGAEILRDFHIWVYPRKGSDGQAACTSYNRRPEVRGVRYLTGAPLFDISSTQIRNSAGDPRPTLRPATTADIPQLRQLFTDTVLNVNIKDYTQEEVEDWASCGADDGHWQDLLTEYTFIAAVDSQDSICGFASINRSGYLHSLFVHKDRQGRGIGSLLLSEAIRIARDHGANEITSDVSITARPFFEHLGFETVREQKAKARHLELTNFHMRKPLSSGTVPKDRIWPTR